MIINHELKSLKINAKNIFNERYLKYYGVKITESIELKIEYTGKNMKNSNTINREFKNQSLLKTYIYMFLKEIDLLGYIGQNKINQTLEQFFEQKIVKSDESMNFYIEDGLLDVLDDYYIEVGILDEKGKYMFYQDYISSEIEFFLNEDDVIKIKVRNRNT